MNFQIGRLILYMMITRYEKIKSQAPTKDPPLCGCGCGGPVSWLVMKGRWAQFRSGHNEKVRARTAEVDLKDPRWAYLLGAHLGDGCDKKRLDIAVGWDEPGWADALEILLLELGLVPRRNGNIRIRCSCAEVLRIFSAWKPGGRAGLWSLQPLKEVHIPAFLAGLVDSDGSVAASSGGMVIYQRDNGNLELLQERLKEAGISSHLGRDSRFTSPIIEGRALEPRPSVRLGLRGVLRDEVAPFLKNPSRAEAWAAYRTAHKSRFNQPSGGKPSSQTPGDACTYEP